MRRKMLIGKKIIGSCVYLGGIPTLPEPFVNCWSQMIQYNNEYLLGPEESIYYTRATVSYHSFARDTLVDQMQGDWILMLDTDQTFEPDLLARMLNLMNKHKVDVLVVPYVYKSDPHPPVLYGYNPKTKKKFIIGDWGKEAEIIQMHSAGGGCLLVKRKVFDKIKSQLKTSPFAIMEPYSEDHSFFERLHKLKIKAYFAPNIDLGHLVFKSLTVAKDYDRIANKTEKESDVQGFK